MICICHKDSLTFKSVEHIIPESPKDMFVTNVTERTFRLVYLILNPMLIKKDDDRIH